MGATRKAALGFVAGVMAVALLLGGGAAWAYWTATAQSSATVTTPRVAVTQVNFNVLRAAYFNTLTNLTSTGSFTVTNTSTVAGAATVAISATDVASFPGGAGNVAPQMPLRMWPGTSDASCKSEQVPNTAASGTWAATSISGVALAAGQAQLFCVRADVPVAQRNALAAPTAPATPTLPFIETPLFNGTVNVSLVAAGWTATATGTALQRSWGIYPLDASLAPATGSRWYAFHPAANTNTCMDVSAAGAAGASVISFPCQRPNNVQAPNQAWQVIPVNEAVGSLVSLQPRHAPDTRLAVSGSQLVTAVSSTAPTQQWYVQRVSPTAVQFVSATDGRCLSMPQSGQLSIAACQNNGTVFITPEGIPAAVAG